MRTLLVLIILLISVSCSRKAVLQESVVVRDTTYVETKVMERDTVILIMDSGVSVTLPKNLPDDFNKIPESKNGKIEKKDGQARLVITDIQDSLLVDCNCDTLDIKAKLYDTFQKENRKIQTEKTITQRVRFIPKWVKVLAWSGVVFYVFIGVRMFKGLMV